MRCVHPLSGILRETRGGLWCSASEFPFARAAAGDVGLRRFGVGLKQRAWFDYKQSPLCPGADAVNLLNSIRYGHRDERVTRNPKEVSAVSLDRRRDRSAMKWSRNEMHRLFVGWQGGLVSHRFTPVQRAVPSTKSPDPFGRSLTHLAALQSQFGQKYDIKKAGNSYAT